MYSNHPMYTILYLEIAFCLFLYSCKESQVCAVPWTLVVRALNSENKEALRAVKESCRSLF